MSLVMLKQGDRVYHREYQDFGFISTNIVPGSKSLTILFDNDDEFEVETSLLVKVLSEHHESLLKETYDL